MQLILTHDQADFDAIGSLLGAALIHEGAIPVLPSRLNRNVRAFQNLYGSELPFVDQKDLSGDPVESIILVDTQSLVTVKGMRRSTRIRVIDHHHKRADISPDWQFSMDNTGACTTLFIEHIRDHNAGINPIQATLLMLGIYEDTGSLTYASTTARDVRAAAYLMDQGASLKIAANFLNPPLSASQRLLYDRLLASAETHHIHGHTVTIVSGHGEDMDEEISSVAHKLRDLLDPDALFVLVITRDGVRLIARSTSDRINVARIARIFGGGGHERASAALLHPTGEVAPDTLAQLLEDTKRQLEKLFPDMVQPSIRVRKIMSHRPLLIAPDTSAQEALSLMQKYGYEGYPVVDNGRVVGLLNRRAVDRAISHRLNLPTSSLMEAGEVTVSPDDPIDHLQDIMTSTGWGQVPVVDPEKKQVIGIVTRTDLLKTLHQGEASLPGHINLAGKLKNSLSPARNALLQGIREQAEKLHLPIYIVGGFVRDLLLGHPGEDFDIVVEGDAIRLAHFISQQYGGRVVTHSRFGTAKWQIKEIAEQLAIQLAVEESLDAREFPDFLDFISARTEFYEYPTALPTVERSSIKLDLHRRDFTINTMAMRLNSRHHGELYDFWGGLADLKQKRIRVLHSLSFVDDPTRMLRAARFEQRFHFHIESRTLVLIKEACDLLHQVSGDRLRHEFNLIFQEDDPPAVFHRLEELQLLAAIIPDLHWGKDQTAAWQKIFRTSAVQHGPAEKKKEIKTMPFELCWLILFRELDSAGLKAACSRLKLPAKISRILIDQNELTSLLPDLAALPVDEAVKSLDRFDETNLEAALALYPEKKGIEIIQKYLDNWKNMRPTINGRDLERMGIPRGPLFRTILDEVRKAWLTGEIQDAAGEREFLKKYLEQFR
jgi:tRNA nucleotidyltransferase (CCA-adding enzyme)